MKRPLKLIGRTDKGPHVKALQKKLKEYGYSSLSEDGIYGHATEEAVRNFQKERGLPADGIVGPQVFKALGLTDALPKAVQQNVGESKSSSENPVAGEKNRSQIFISYSHRDKDWLDELQTHLAPLVRNKTISVWADTQIKPGDEWRKQIEKALAEAKAAVLLVTKNFIASDFIAHKELPPLLEAAKKEGLKILWIAVRTSFYEETEIAKYQALNNPSRPLASFQGDARDRAFVEVCQKIKSAIISD